MQPKLNHFTNYYKNPFSLKTSSNKKYVIGEIQPGYALFINTMGIDPNLIDDYLDGVSFQPNYDKAVKLVSQYIIDIMNKSNLADFSKAPLLIVIVKTSDGNYVVKGEFVLRVINDFLLGKIKLGGTTTDTFLKFVSKNTPYWKDSLIEMNETTINVVGELSAYTYLLDRYEVLDEEYIERIKTAVDLFIF